MADRNQFRTWTAQATEAVESRLWPLPVGAVILAILLGILVPLIDKTSSANLAPEAELLVFRGGAEAARTLLSTIAGSLITVTSLTFSLTVVALQLASSNASPRVLRLFARDRHVHATLSVFLGTFVFALTVLRSVRDATDAADEFVPRFAVTTALILTMISVVLLVLFLAHLARQLRVETILKDIHAETDRSIDLLSDTHMSAVAYEQQVVPPTSSVTVLAASSGFITSRDRDALVEFAGDQRIVIQELRDVGDNVVIGTPLAQWWERDGASARLDAEAIATRVQRAHAMGYERTAAQDIDYGIQQIVEIAVRALSPGVNDPATAVHALGHLSALIARIVAMPAIPAALSTAQGDLAVVTLAAQPSEVVDSALSLIRHYGASDPILVRRFLQLIEDVNYVSSDPEVRAALLRQLTSLDQQLAGADQDPAANAELRMRVEGLMLEVQR